MNVVDALRQAKINLDNWTLVTDENGKQLVSNTQRYKALGNAWTVDVIAHIFSFILPEWLR